MPCFERQTESCVGEHQAGISHDVAVAAAAAVVAVVVVAAVVVALAAES